MNPLFSLKYYLNTNPPNFSLGAYKIFAIFFIILISINILVVFIKRKYKGPYHKLLNKVQTFTISNFSIGIFLLFFSYEEIPILSARFWHIIWFFGILFWIAQLLKEFSKIPEKKQKRAEALEFKKYLP